MPLLSIFKELIFKIINLMNMKKIVKWAFLLGIAFSPLYGMAESSNTNSNEATEVAQATSLPSVTEIKGFELAPNGVMEEYRAVLSSALPAGAYVEWILIPDDEDVSWNGDNIGESIFLTFRKTGKQYQLTARVRGADGSVGMGRYMNITVGQ